MTSFNDKAADELFMLLLRVCITVCVFASLCVCVNNSEKKPFVFRGAKAKTHLKHMGGNHIESSEQ